MKEEEKYTLGKEPEAVILWKLIGDNEKKKKRVISSRLHSYNVRIKEIVDSNLTERTKKSIITGMWHSYKDSYIENYGYNKDNKIDTFYMCLLKIRFREAIGYKYTKKEKNEN